MPCSHHFSHFHGYAMPTEYPCPYCGYYRPPGQAPGWQIGWAPPRGYVPPAAPRMRDEDIRRTVGDYLRADPRIPPQSKIHVEVREGVVTLTGLVPDKWVKHAANEIVLGLPDVVDVQNNLQVTPPAGRGPEVSSAQ